MRGAVSADYVYMLIASPAHLASAKLVQYIESETRRLGHFSVLRWATVLVRPWNSNVETNIPGLAISPAAAHSDFQ